MEEDQIQEFKHACKFCNKSFPCGRSLGGHMRSHINNLSAEKTEQKQKLSIKINNGSCIGSEAATNGSYGLRENPKKTWRKRVADSSEDSYVYDKFCKECGKSFHSWQALFGHMKCHSEKERVSNSLEDQDSWTNNAKDVQSDNEITAPNKKKRSKRTRIRCNMEAAATVTASSSVSEVGHEQEEVAMSLIMLSRDVSPWSGLHSLAAESSDNNSVYFEARSSVRTNLVTKFDADIAKLMKQSEKKKYELSNSVSKKFNFKGKSSELLDTEKGFRMIKTGVSIKGFLKSTKSELDYVSTLEDSEVENGKSRVNGTESAISKSATIKSSVNKPHHHLEDEFIKNFSKRGKFECATCNKIFHSYQALGGHRASHKKNKGCFASKIESSENSIEFETDLSHDHEPATESKLMKISENNIEYVQNIAETVRDSKKKIKGHHECPICFKVFQSGQALGGHKRSHMVVAGSESRVVLEEQVPQIRDFLDLNLPAATEEESNSHADSNRPWWILEGNHNQEALVG